MARASRTPEQRARDNKAAMDRWRRIKADPVALAEEREFRRRLYHGLGGRRFPSRKLRRAASFSEREVRLLALLFSKATISKDLAIVARDTAFASLAKKVVRMANQVEDIRSNMSREAAE